MATLSLSEEIKLDVHENNVFIMNEFREQNLFCDVTLDIDGTLFPCHRLILMAWSPYFRTMFNGNFKESSSNTISIQEIGAETMEIILYAVYTSRIRLLPENVHFVLKASHLFQMDVIFNACVDSIMMNATHIHYLIETCLFAKTIELQKLYDYCVEGIAADFLHWGKTDSFLNLPFEAVREVLSKVSSTSSFTDDDLFATIIKWCKNSHTSATDIKVLVQTPKFTSRALATSLIAELVFNSGKSFSSSEDNNDENSDDKLQSNCDMNLNVYLHGVDVKSGAKGWGTLKLNDSFDTYTLLNFRPEDSSFRRICTIGTKIYCFEWDCLKKKCRFSYYAEDSVEVTLKTPNNFPCHSENCNFEMIAVENNIYLFYVLSDTNIWIYNCELGRWQYSTLGFGFGNSFARNIKAALQNCSNWFALTSLDHGLYVIGCKDCTNNSDERYIAQIDTRTKSTTRNYTAFPKPFQHENSAVCAFDGKIVVSGSDHSGTLHNTFSIFDVTAGQWRTDLKPMNDGRARHKLIHNNGFIYTLDSRSFMKNEKYDVGLNTWIEMPNLPDRVQSVNADSVKATIGCKQIFHVNVDSPSS
ncbi:kelch-like protein 40a [Planococcus citri]|uniref:kelch-like protein 40a n=1 Tax=Planococcus citri TaxID=170843 RepID=UPI0031F9190D